MTNRLKLSLCVFAFLFLAACAGSKGGGNYDDEDDGGSGGGGGSRKSGQAAPKADDVKKVREEATSLTEENHKLAREVFDLKNKLGEE